MTVLGKILVFVNLIFSLLTGGLIVMAYTTRTNWAAQNATLLAGLRVVQASAAADLETKQREVNAKEAQVQAGDRQRQEAVAAATKAREDLTGAQDRLNALQAALSAEQQNNKGAADELARRKAEVDRLTELVGEREKKIVDIDRQMAKLRDEAVSFKIQYESAAARNKELLAQIQSKDAEIAQMRRQLGPGGGPTTPTSPTRTAVPDDVKGTIRKVEGDYATITPGSDAGVAVGAELQVFRTAPRPEYLGKLVILAVTPHEAVGRLEGPAKGRVRVNDEVAARLR